MSKTGCPYHVSDSQFFRVSGAHQITIDSAIFALIDREYSGGGGLGFFWEISTFLSFTVRARLWKLAISATEGRVTRGKIRALLRWLSIEDVFAREGRAELCRSDILQIRLPTVGCHFSCFCQRGKSKLKIPATEGRAVWGKFDLSFNVIRYRRGTQLAISRISCQRGKSWCHDELIRTTSWQVKSNQVNSNHTRPSQIPQCPDDLSGIAISPSEREELKPGRATPGKSSPTKSIQIKPNRSKSSQVKTIQITSSAIEVRSYFLSERGDLNSEATKSGRSHWA